MRQRNGSIKFKAAIFAAKIKHLTKSKKSTGNHINILQMQRALSRNQDYNVKNRV